MSQRQDPRLNLFHQTGGVARRIVFTAHQVGALRFRVASDRVVPSLVPRDGTLLTSDSKDSASSSLKDDAVAHGTTPNRSSGGARNPH